MKDFKKITKAVIAVAGYGTRFLPATKNIPKEMLPIIDKPIIHYLVEEAVASGITDVILVTRTGTGTVEDYFDNHVELEYQLEKSGKSSYLEMVNSIPQMANFFYVRQKRHLPYGNATPLLSAMPLIDNDEAFVYMFGDDLTISNTAVPITKQLIDIFEEQRPSALMGVQEVPESEVHKYGTVRYKPGAPYKYDIETILEKLPAAEAPSRMAQFGRFVFSYDVLEEVQKKQTGKDGELWVADVQNAIAQSEKRVIAQPVDGEWLTTGDPLNYLKATYRLAMLRDDLREPLGDFISKQLNQM